MIEILEQTPGLVACIKPVGVRAQGEGENDLPALLKRQLGCEIYPVHRLDQAVGGVMVFAKTEKMAAKLSKAIQEGKLQKEYLAVLTKRPEEDSGELHDLLFHDRFKNKTFAVSKERKGVKKAALSYRVLAESNGRCLVHVRLYTGRTHQIRVQFASRGCPLVGDGKYASNLKEKKLGFSYQALYSYKLQFAFREECMLSYLDGKTFQVDEVWFAKNGIPGILGE